MISTQPLKVAYLNKNKNFNYYQNNYANILKLNYSKRIVTAILA
jgi:hypothetical protein